MGGNQSDIEFKQQTINGIKNICLFKSNSKYIIEKFYLSSRNIKLYTMNKNENGIFNIKFESEIKNESMVYDIELHPKYSRLLLSSLYDGNINLWEIPKSKENDLIIKSTIHAHDSTVICSSFNPKFDNIFLSSSENEIKIWDLNKFTYQNNYSYKNTQNIIKWKDENKFGYFKDKNIYINDCENEKNNQILNINELIKDFFFIKNDQFITVNDEYVKLYDIRKNSQSNILNINQIIKKYIYDSNLDYLYLISNDDLQILDLNEFKLLDQIYKGSMSKPILLKNENVLKNNTSNILYCNKEGLKLMTIINNNKIFYNQPSSQQIEIPKEFYDNIIPIISNYSDILRNEENEMEEDEIIKKKNIWIMKKLKLNLIKLKIFFFLKEKKK
jgi:WD40 repeat protein